ncbi:MAG: NADH-quinone oxidoreductase subunit A [Candidatus Micrarchaeaceae archaeon]
MLFDYIALALFIAFAVFVPASFLLTVKLLAHREPGNPVKNSPYESAEETVGDSRNIENEYMPYFMIFLPFEVIIVILILWSTATSYVSYSSSVSVMVLGVLATVLSFIGYKVARG